MKGVKNIVAMCKLRKMYNLNCRDCVYNENYCDKAKTFLKVKRPSEYDFTNIAKEKEKKDEVKQK